jgi:hypothetical protein
MALHSALNFRPFGVSGNGLGPNSFRAVCSKFSVGLSKEKSLNCPTISICAVVSAGRLGDFFLVGIGASVPLADSVSEITTVLERKSSKWTQPSSWTLLPIRGWVSSHGPQESSRTWCVVPSDPLNVTMPAPLSMCVTVKTGSDDLNIAGSVWISMFSILLNSSCSRAP